MEESIKSDFCSNSSLKILYFFNLNSIIINIIWMYSKMLAIERRYILENEKKLWLIYFLYMTILVKKKYEKYIYGILFPKKKWSKKKKRKTWKDS